MKINVKYISMLSVILFSSVYGEANEELTLIDSIISAYNNNDGWKAAQEGKNAAEAQHEQTKAVFFPSLSASFGAGRSGQRTTLPALEDRVYSKGKTTRTEMSLRLNQNLFKSFQDVNNMKSKGNAAKAAEYSLKSEEQKLIINVVASYTSIWAEQEKLKAYKQREENLAKIVEAQKASLAEGMATPADVADAESKWQSAIYDRINAESNLSKAKAYLTSLTHKKVTAEVKLPNLNLNIPSTLEELKKVAMESNPEIIQGKFAAEAAENDVAAAKGAFGPVCNASVSAVKSLNKPDDAIERKDTRSYDASISVEIPIVTVPTYYGMKYASNLAQRAKFTAEDKKLEIARNCEIYWSAHIAAVASTAAAVAAVRSSEITSESNFDQFMSGLKSLMEYLDGENARLNARINLATALKEKVDMLVQLCALMGQLSLESISQGCREQEASKVKK